MTVSRWFIPRIGVVDSKGTSIVTGHKYQQVIFKVSIISNHTREDPTHGHHQMVNTEIKLIIFFAVKDVEALYSQQKQDQELSVAQMMNF